MALAANEAWTLGFVRNTSTSEIATTTSTVGARWQGGFLRDLDGRLVVVGG